MGPVTLNMSIRTINTVLNCQKELHLVDQTMTEVSKRVKDIKGHINFFEFQNNIIFLGFRGLYIIVNHFHSLNRFGKFTIA